MKAVALALMCRGDRWFLQRRDPANAVLPGFWEFPGGKVDDGEAIEEALARELREETHLLLRSARPCPAIDGSPRLHPFFVEADGKPCTDLAWGWFTVDEMLRLSIPPRNCALIEMLAAEPRNPPSHLIG